MTKRYSKLITLLCGMAFVLLCAYLISAVSVPGKTDCPSPQTIDKQFHTSVSGFPMHFSRTAEKNTGGSEIYCYEVGMDDSLIENPVIRICRNQFSSVPKKSDFTYLYETQWDDLDIQVYTAEKTEPYKPYLVITFSDDDGYYNIRMGIIAEYKENENLREEDLARIKACADQVKPRS